MIKSAFFQFAASKSYTVFILLIFIKVLEYIYISKEPCRYYKNIFITLNKCIIKEVHSPFQIKENISIAFFLFYLKACYAYSLCKTFEKNPEKPRRLLIKNIKK